jgi:hypothetical protein
MARAFARRWLPAIIGRCRPAASDFADAITLPRDGGGELDVLWFLL